MNWNDEADARLIERETLMESVSVKAMTAAELQRKVFPPIKWVIPDYIAEGLNILAGKAKMGKSYMVLDWSLAVSMGGYAFGKIKVEQGDVLYLTLEDNWRRVQQRIAQLLDNGEEWPTRLHLALDWPRLDDGGLEKIESWCRTTQKPRLIVIDTGVKVRGSRTSTETLYESDYRLLKDEHRIANEYGVAIIDVGHLRKMEADDPFDSVSGSTGVTGAADSVLILKRDAAGTTLYGRGRDIEEFEAAVTFDKVTGRWSVLGPAAQVRRSDERTAILDALSESAEPLSPKEIADTTGHDYDAVRQMLVRMGKAGEVTKVARGKYTHNNSHKVTSAHPAPEHCDDVTNVTGFSEDDFEERAAILEHDAGLPREAAEAQARGEFPELPVALDRRVRA
ncbi:MAG: AAA family ATPase [Xanthobacteraceae bacterium]